MCVDSANYLLFAHRGFPSAYERAHYLEKNTNYPFCPSPTGSCLLLKEKDAPCNRTLFSMFLMQRNQFVVTGCSFLTELFVSRTCRTHWVIRKHRIPRMILVQRHQFFVTMNSFYPSSLSAKCAEPWSAR